jgi:F-box domain
MVDRVNFEDFSNEVVFEVFGHLDLVDLFWARATCRWWREICGSMISGIRQRDEMIDAEGEFLRSINIYRRGFSSARFVWYLRERRERSYTRVVESVIDSTPSSATLVNIFTEFWSANQDIDIDWKYLLWIIKGDRAALDPDLQYIMTEQAQCKSATDPEDKFYYILAHAHELDRAGLSWLIGQFGNESLARYFHYGVCEESLMRGAVEGQNLMLIEKYFIGKSNKDFIVKHALESGNYDLVNWCFDDPMSVNWFMEQSESLRARSEGSEFCQLAGQNVFRYCSPKKFVSLNMVLDNSRAYERRDQTYSIIAEK